MKYFISDYEKQYMEHLSNIYHNGFLTLERGEKTNRNLFNKFFTTTKATEGLYEHPILHREEFL